MRRSLSSLACASRLVADNLAEKNGEESWTLPVPGTLVIASASPDEVLAVLDKL